jgi:hypothetical protein
MFLNHLLMLTANNSNAVRSLDTLTEYSARFNEFDQIKVLTLCNQIPLTPVARYQVDDRVLLISYDTATHRYCIDAEYPNSLWETDEFNMSDVAYSPQYYQALIQDLIEDGFSSDFNPIPKIWEAEDLTQGIYSRRRDPSGGRSGSMMAVAEPSFGRWVMQKID